MARISSSDGKRSGSTPLILTGFCDFDNGKIHQAAMPEQLPKFTVKTVCEGHKKGILPPK